MIDNLSVITRLIPNDARFGGGFALGEAEGGIKRTLHDRIQAMARKELSPDDYHLRGMWLCNTRDDYYNSHFTKSGLAEVVELAPGSPTIRSHNHGGAPTGKLVDAVMKKRDLAGWAARDSWWAKCIEMIPADAEGTALVNRMDMNVENEVSIGWRCLGADCSVCGDPIWSCSHIPGEVYKRHGIARYGFSGVTSVLEASHVVRGGQIDTGMEGPEARSAFEHGTRDIAWDLITRSKRSQKSLSEFLTGAEYGRAIGFGALFGMPGERANVQSIVVQGSRFDGSADIARRWLRDNDFRVDGQKADGSTLTFEQFPERQAERDSFWEQKLDDGIVARICTRAVKQEQREQAPDGARSLREWVAGPSA